MGVYVIYLWLMSLKERVLTCRTTAEGTNQQPTRVLSSATKPSANKAAAALRMAAFTLIHSKSALGAYMRRQKARLGAPKAITATAHKMARLISAVAESRRPSLSSAAKVRGVPLTVSFDSVSPNPLRSVPPVCLSSPLPCPSKTPSLLVARLLRVASNRLLRSVPYVP